MFEKGDYIVYGTSGVCAVADITTMNMDGISRDRLYYVLTPLSQSGGKIFTPVDNQNSLMREIISEAEAEKLIEDLGDVEVLGIAIEKQREKDYKACMKTCDCKEWFKIIKTLYLRKMERSAQGKKITSTDEKYLKMAEEALYSELSIPLGIPKNQMVEYITTRVGWLNRVELS